MRNNLDNRDNRDNNETERKQEAPSKPVKDKKTPRQNPDSDGHNPDKDDTQAERANKLNTFIKGYETINKCVLNIHNYKVCAAEYIKLNPEQNYDQALVDIKHIHKIDDSEDKQMSSAYGEVVTVEVLKDIDEIWDATGKNVPASKGDKIQVNKMTAKALTQKHIAKVIS